MKYVKFFCLYGAASDNIDENYKSLVYEMCKNLAKLNFGMIYGAGSSGLMGAAADGINSGNGIVVGVTPHFMRKFEPIYSNSYLNICTESMDERKKVMKMNADAFIIVPGGIGTFDEFFETLTEKELKKHDKPIILLNINGFYDDLLKVINTYIKKGFIRATVKELFDVANTTDEAINILLSKGI